MDKDNSDIMEDGDDTVILDQSATDYRVRVYSVVDFGEQLENPDEPQFWAKVQCRIEKFDGETSAIEPESRETIVTLDTEESLEHFVSAVNALEYADLFNLDEQGFYISLGSHYGSLLDKADTSKMN